MDFFVFWLPPIKLLVKRAEKKKATQLMTSKEKEKTPILDFV